jgi:A/G-specific adenine glycosylase
LIFDFHLRPKSTGKAQIKPLAGQLLAWYGKNARRLPWRGHPDPYAVWVSEVMLQQTRVETVIPYFERWMARFPTIPSLAAASQQDVLAAWEGLGYYSRARNLHRAAQVLAAEQGGKLPEDLDSLRLLPGIGRYTAAAIASIAFGKDAPTLDGNIRRVLARIFNLELPARSPEGERRLWDLAAEHLPAGQAGEYNQALMDLGATICTPRQPDCPHCPVNDLCAAYALGIQEQRPVLEPKPSLPHYTVAAAVIQRDGQVLIAQRPAQGLLGGMWEFPGRQAAARRRPGKLLATGDRRRAGRQGSRAGTDRRLPACLYSLPGDPARLPLHAGGRRTPQSGTRRPGLGAFHRVEELSDGQDRSRHR